MWVQNLQILTIWPPHHEEALWAAEGPTKVPPCVCNLHISVFCTSVNWENPSSLHFRVVWSTMRKHSRSDAARQIQQVRCRKAHQARRAKQKSRWRSLQPGVCALMGWSDQPPSCAFLQCVLADWAKHFWQVFDAFQGCLKCTICVWKYPGTFQCCSTVDEGPSDSTHGKEVSIWYRVYLV